jgi:hypothetical protein
MKTRLWQLVILFAMGVITLLVYAAAGKKSAPVTGYVIDSACTYVKNLEKPVSSECAQECARNGSPLVILAEDGTIYWPIDLAMPAQGQNEKLLPYAGQRVDVTGKRFNRGGSRAIAIETIKAVPGS